MTKFKEPWKRWGGWFLFFLWCALYISFLGHRPFATPDEGRYVEIPREMVVSNDYLTPRLNGVKYFEKPPLMYWIQTLSWHWWGANETGARLWVVAFAFAGCALVYHMGRVVFGRAAGIWGSVVLATSPLYFSVGHIIILDMPVSVMISAAGLFFITQYQTTSAKKRLVYRLASFGCAGCAVMTKGLMACVLPAVTLVIWILTTPHKERLKDLFCPWGWLLFLAISVPWHVLVSLRNPEFPWFYFVHEHVLRYLTKAHHRYQPFWFFTPIFWWGMAPWITFLSAPWRWMKEDAQDPFVRFLMINTGFVLLFFSLSSSKLAPYILPSFPLTALWIGHRLSRILQAVNGHDVLRKTWPLRVITQVALLGGMLFFQRQDANFHTTKHSILVGLAGIIILATLLIERQYIRRSKEKIKSLIVVTMGAAGLLMIVKLIAPDIQKTSNKGLVQALHRVWKPGDHVISYACYDQDIPPYWGQTIGVVGWQGELEFGASIEDVSAWMMSDAMFQKIWKSDQRVFVIMPVDQVKNWLPGSKTMIAQNDRRALISNQ